jgi:hypothetical protein
VESIEPRLQVKLAAGKPDKKLAVGDALVLPQSDYDWLILSQFRMGKSSGATRIWMLRGTPG